jgi:DNA invertase Pin-like site-specific DNA recombinase
MFSRWRRKALMTDAHKRKFDVVVVWKFDRFNALGIGFVSLSESLDTSTPSGKMVFTVLGAVAELERSLIGERVKAGLRNAKANGKKLGRPTVEFSDGDIQTLIGQGKSMSAIATQLGINKSTVSRRVRMSA